jgi:hypothetical protein
VTQAPKTNESAADQIDAKIAAMPGWKSETLARIRALIKQADPQVVETVKWRKPSNPDGVPVWEHAGIICTGEAYKAHVKVTFAKGAALPDPSGLLNSGNGNTMRAIDIREGEVVDQEAFKNLVRAAVALNEGSAASKARV